MFKRILVPVDGSRTAESGLRTAIRMARDEKAALILLHVVDEKALVLAGDYAGRLHRPIHGRHARGREENHRGGRRDCETQGVTARTVLVESIGPRRVADVIVQQARKQRADAIVIGTHGRRGLSRMVMGSDAEEVVRGSPVPVVLVRAERAGESSRPHYSPAPVARSFLPGRK